MMATLALMLSCMASGGKIRNSFAIVVDSDTYTSCKDALEKYREAVSFDGLEAFIIQADWQSPEQVKDTLLHYYENEMLEGAVFIGDIPVPMIRKAHHLTSAFKMDEGMDWRDSSVPSDRFYDDFDLKFNFIRRDSVETGFFYYELAPESPQYIESDIYTGRIKSSDTYGDKYVQISRYLEKAAAAKYEDNVLDEVTSYTGDGSFSNSLIAWKDECITLREQLPAAFGKDREATFLLYAMQPFVKDMLLDQIRRDDLDLMLFHEHGTPERQYLSGIPSSDNMDDYYESGKRAARSMVRSNVRYGKTPEEAMAYVMEKFGLDSTWVCDAFDPEVMKADSLYDLKTGIVLSDIEEACPNVRMAIFDACYNGDFRESDCIASRYIFSKGKTLVGIGNSVNVLQDKSSSDLLGMLDCGYRVGEWMRMTNILESHIIGDPTFHFTASDSGKVKPDLYNTDVEYWRAFTSGECPCDIRGLALHKLFSLNAEGLSNILLDTYVSAKEYMLRLQCMHLLAHYNDGNYSSLLMFATDDPYEFIRRKAAHFIGKVGDTDFLAPALAQMYLREYNAGRVAFNIGYAAAHFPEAEMDKAFNDALESADYVFDKEAFRKGWDNCAGGQIRMARNAMETLPQQGTKWRKLYLQSLRNEPYPYIADVVLNIIKDGSEDLSFRVQAAEVLGWFTRAWNRAEICRQLEEYQGADGVPVELKNEITRTLGRLAVYMR